MLLLLVTRKPEKWPFLLKQVTMLTVERKDECDETNSNSNS